MRGRPALTIGNFDGVHCGHQALIRAARDLAGSGVEVIALVFDPHPISVLRPAASPTPLSTFAQRTRWLRATGANLVIRLEPSQDTLSMSPDTFLEWICERWRPSFIVEGSDFRFGRNRAGSVEDLWRTSAARGFEVRVIEPVEATLSDHSIVRCSSSVARWLVSRGRVRDAAIVLGRPYEIESTVEQGARRGRALGFPTINLANNGGLLPADGVYLGEAELPDGSSRTAAISVGTNPTFAPLPKSCEAYLLDWSGGDDEYGWTVRLRFTMWLRDQIAFSTVEALRDQLARDIDRVRSLTSPTLAGATA